MKLEDYKRQYGSKEAKPVAVAEPVIESPTRPIQDVVAGELLSDNDGACFVSANHYHVSHRHGPHRLSDLSRMPASWLALACRDPELSYVDMRSTVFLDTETTGLGMGVGTYVFLVGVGYLDGDGFTVKQFFLERPGDEKVYLRELSRFLQRFSTLVTFNGKAFDWPLLENRYILKRETQPFYDPQHIDLLHPARRLWKRRLSSCALSSLEQHLLGVERTEEDVPGYLIPALYFQYQLRGDTESMRRVFYHNLHDILSLASLTLHMTAILEDPLATSIQYPQDLFSLGRMFEKGGDVDRAGMCYEEALRAGLAGELQQECLVALSLLQKRERRWDGAMQSWDRLLDMGGWHTLFARVEYAKYYEHVERDYTQAIYHTEHAIDITENGDAAWPELGRRELERRLARLLNRASRTRQWARGR